MQVQGPKLSIGSDSFGIRNIYCIGRNYAEHAKELNNPIPSTPLVFLKSSASLRGLQQQPVAFSDESFHHEVELVLLVGKNLPMNTRPAMDAVSAIGLGLDLTRRDAQTKIKQDGHPWTLAKSFKGSAVVAPLLLRHDMIDLNNLVFGLDVNGEVRQRGRSSDMLTKPLAILTYLLTFNDLYEGDLIFTGTPKGVATIKQGDTFRIFIEGLSYDYTGVF